MSWSWCESVLGISDQQAQEVLRVSRLAADDRSVQTASVCRRVRHRDGPGFVVERHGWHGEALPEVIVRQTLTGWRLT